ncbi:ArpU family phage packaging/lysis transcriptional regulator [Brevibacillus sp. JB24b]|uniref:ArpU family phage packaging/lysis transcriptional regulator n=1 Tax=Brevibacillus sp. JB24b TaxID=3422308 RepID=UPI003F688657
MQMSFFAEIDQKETHRAVESAFEQYRLNKYLMFEEREANTTAGYTERFHGPTNVTSDQTASIAIHNVDTLNARKAYCSLVERAVNNLPRKERYLIEERYMCREAEYITDYNVYNFKFDPPISKDTYRKIRKKAFRKLAMVLNIQVEKSSSL